MTSTYNPDVPTIYDLLPTAWDIVIIILLMIFGYLLLMQMFPKSFEVTVCKCCGCEFNKATDIFLDIIISWLIALVVIFICLKLGLPYIIKYLPIPTT